MANPTYGPAPSKPATRQPVPWDPWCWLEIQVATATGSTADPNRVGYWQPTPAVTADPRYTVWQATGVPIPPAGTMPPSGYGEWVQGNTGDKWGTRWNDISWRPVDCDTFSANFSTGGNPWDWNAPPGNGTLSLVDNAHTYYPSGPGSGYFDDIGVNTPIRVIAHLTYKFNSSSLRQSHRVLINGLIRSIEHTISTGGEGRTTIHFSEPHVLYGRVDRNAIHLGAANELGRYIDIHGLSDDPATGLMQYPLSADTQPGWAFLSLQATDVAADLWSEIAKTGNSIGHVLAMRLYANQIGNFAGDPRVHSLIPRYPPTPNTGSDQNSYGLDTRIVTTRCSPDATTFNYTGSAAANRVKIENSPINDMTFGHDDQDLANAVSISASGGTATTLSDQTSIDRFYRHSYQRHDLVSLPADTPTVAARFLDRLVKATFHVSDCDYIMDEPRDFEFALGAYSNVSQSDHPVVEPGRWMKLDWGWVKADLRVTKVTHAISPARWTVTHAYEVHNPVATSGGAL